MPAPLLPTLPPAALSDGTDARIERLRRAPGDRARTEAARELEVTFLTEMLGAMRKTVPESDFLPRAPSRDVYDGLFDRAVAEAMATRDPLGVVKAMADADASGKFKLQHGVADKEAGQSGPVKGRAGGG
jgi:Rod binding domain-containing protein